MRDRTAPPWRNLNLFAPSDEHRMLGETLDDFVTREVEPQAAAHDREERFNLALFRRAGELGLLGITVARGGRRRRARRRRRRDGPRGPVHRRPGIRPRLPGTRILFVNNFYHNASAAQRAPDPAARSLRRMGRRHVHDRAGGRHRRARHAHHGAPRWRSLCPERTQDLHHQRRHRRLDAGGRVSGLRANRRTRHHHAAGREGLPGILPRAALEGQARGTRLDHRRAGLREHCRSPSTTASATRGRASRT